MDVKISGVIVSADYDTEWAASYIDKGCITPSNRVVSAIDGATDPVDVVIDSYGGDVFAAGEMQIALIKGIAAGRVKSVTVGSKAASAAANMVAAVRAAGADVRAFSNSLIMYHSCYTCAQGGADAHRDTAEALDGINAAVIGNLEKCGIKDCAEWFAEGREKWITAEEALDMGLITAIDDCGEIIQAERGAVASVCARFAACGGMTAENIESVLGAPEAAAVADDDFEKRVEAAANERFARLQSAHDKKISDMTSEIEGLRASLAEAEATRNQLTASVESLTASLAEVRDQLAAEVAAHQSVTSAVLGAVKTEEREVDHRAVLASLPVSKRAAYYKAHASEIDR